MRLLSDKVKNIFTKKRKFSAGTPLHNISRLAIGSVISQGILTGSTPILTRLFSPESFGIASLISAVYGLLIPLITLKYDQAILTPKRPQKAKLLGSMVIEIATINCLIVGFVVVLYMFYFRGEFRLCWLLLPLYLWIGAGYSLIQQWCARLNCYTYFSRGMIISALFNVTICLGSALIIPDKPFFLVLGLTGGMTVAFAYNIYGFKEWPYRTRKLNLQKIFSLMKEYISFPVLVLPSVLISVFSPNTVPLLLSQHFSLEDLGLYTVANRIILIPAALLGGSLAEAFRCEFATTRLSGLAITPVFKKHLIPIVFLSAILFGIIYTFCPYALSFVFGSKFSNSSSIAQSLVFAGFSLFACTPFAYVCSIFFKSSGLIGQVFLGIFPIITLLTLLKTNALMTQALFGYSITTFLGALLLLWIMYRECIAYDQKYKTKAS